MLLKLTLEPNCSDRERYYRFIKYVRVGDRVLPYGVTRGRSVLLSWGAIERGEIDPEFEVAWRQHVASQPRFWVKAA